jgi:PAS domain S-box-containing protein
MFNNKSVSKETTRKLSALECVCTNVMIADADHNIVFMNEGVMQLMKGAEKEIQRDLPNFSAAKLVGSNIDVFHKNPAHQRGMLEHLKSTYKTTIKVGGRLFDLIATPIIDPQNNNRIGTVVEWSDAAFRLLNREYEAGFAAIGKSQAVISFNMDGTIIEANENFLGCLGYSLNEVQGKYHSMFVEPAHANGSEYKEFWAKLKRGEFIAADFKRIGKGGKVVWVNASYNPILDEKGIAYKVVKYATDITEQVDRNALVKRIVTDNMGAVEEAVLKANEAATTAASSAQQATQNVQSVAAAAEEMSASVKEIASNMSKSKAAVDQVVEKAESADTASKRLTTAAASMGGIVELIRSIAGQINLLALNATIEAARAGDAGKGFAVVASEVKELATQTTKATEQISQEIDSMCTVSDDVAAALASIKQSISDVSEYVAGVASAIEEQSSVTMEISSSMQMASEGMDNINENFSNIVNSTQEASKAAMEVKEAAQVLAD